MSRVVKKRSNFDDAAMRAFGERTAELTHDLTNTLGALLLRLDALSNDPACTKAQSVHIDAIRAICAVATTSVGQLHDFVAKAVKRKRSC
jgi:hypothetical protein